MPRTSRVLFVLLLCAAAAGAQAKTPPPGWFEGDALTESSLSGVWWIKLPFTFHAKADEIEPTKNEILLTSRYVIFGDNGILYRSTLSRNEPKSAIGVWLLKDEKLFVTLSGTSLELVPYMVQADKILVAGTSQSGQYRASVSGMLVRIAETRTLQMMDDEGSGP